MQSSKPRVIKDFDKLDEITQEQIKLAFPYGFHEELIHFNDREGKRVSALPFETDEKYYLVRMTKAEARAIIEDDDDFDDEGMLKEEVKGDYEAKFADVNHMAEFISDESVEDDDSEKSDSEDSDDEEDDNY